MAGYSAVIDLRVNGLDGLRTVSDRIESINRLIKQVKPVPTLFDKRGTDELKAAKRELDLLVKAYADGGNKSAAFSTSIAGLNQQLGTFRSIAANAKTSSEQFTNALKAAELASNRLTNAELQRFSTLKDLYTRKATGGLSAEEQGPSGLTKSVLDLGKNLPSSIAGLRTYAAELDRIFTLVEAGSVDFRTLQKEIARVNREIDIATGAGAIQGPALPPGMRGGAGARGLTSPIGGRADIPGSPAALAAASAARTKLFENLALGAGFPLLFGGGPGQVLGGLLGSFVGTGFGGQILGSAIFGQLEQLGIAANEAGTALQKPIDNFGVIEKRAILASSSQERYVKNLIDAGQYIEATAAVQKRYNEIVGRQGSQDLVRLAKVSDELSRAWSELSLVLQSALAGPLAEFINWLAGVVDYTAMAVGTGEGRRQTQIAQGLSPERRKELQKREQEILQGANLFNEAEKRKQVAELYRQAAGEQPGQIEQQVKGFKEVETQLLASLERRKEIQGQINRLRESEISTGQKQVQNELTLLNTQKQFALSLNQESTIINQIANKKFAAADAEYALTQRQQQALVINAQLELNVAEAKAKAAAEEMRQLDAANKLTPLRQAELQAVMENVVVARNNLEITKGIADNVTRSAAAQAQHTAQMAELERRQAQVNAYAEEYSRINERISRELDAQSNALNNRASLLSAISQATQTINNIEIESLTRELERTSSVREREKILEKIYRLEVENAKAILQATRAQIQAELQRAEVAYRKVLLEQKMLEAVVAIARAQGIVTREHYEALKIQEDALAIAKHNVDTAVHIADVQWKAADAVFKAAVDAAKLKKEMGGVASAAGEFAGNMERATAAAGGLVGKTTTGAPFAAYGGAMAIEDPGLQKKAIAIYKAAEARAKNMPMAIAQSELERARAQIAKLAFQEYASKNKAAGNFLGAPTPAAEASAISASPTPIPTTQPLAMGLSMQPGGGAGTAIVDRMPTINLQTGPVLQQDDGNKYVSLGDLEKILQDFAAVVFNNARSTGGRRFQGVA